MITMLSSSERLSTFPSVNQWDKPRRAPYAIIGQAFGFPLVLGTLHTIHADLCLIDGDTCQPKPQDTSIPVYSIPVPDQPGDTVWMDLSATWWQPLTVEETGAQSGDATGKDIPHPKGLLSSMKDGESLDQLTQRLRWNLLTAPVVAQDILDEQDPEIETVPFQRVVPHARLDVTEPGLYEVELAVAGDDGEQLVVDKARFISLDVDAHWPGTMAEPGPLVSDDEENDPRNLFLAVDDDDDNFDNVVDNALDATTGSSTVDAVDDELLTIIVRKFVPPVDGEGTLELRLSDELRLFTADGAQVIASPLSIDVAHPTGQLAGVVSHDVAFLVEALKTSDHASIQLVYTQAGQDIVQDELNITIVAPEITGSFTRGSVRYSKTVKLDAGWLVCGELTPNRPMSVLVPNPLYAYGIQGAIRYGQTSESEANMLAGTLVSDRYFTIQAALYNGIIAPINGILTLLGRPLLEPYKADTLAEMLSQASGISVEDLWAGKYFVTNSFTEPGEYRVQFFKDAQKTQSFSTVALYVLKLDLDIYHGDASHTEVPDEDEETLGAVTLVNLNDSDLDGVHDHADTVVENGDPDLMKLVLHALQPASLVDDLALGELTVNLHVHSDAVMLWAQSSKETLVSVGNNVSTFSVADLEKTLWIEAIAPSQIPGDIQIDLEFAATGTKDTVRATAKWGDLDIDSDNDNGLSARPTWIPTDAEDAIEDDPGQPGKFLVVTDSDEDNDGIPEFADENLGGYLYHFTPLTLEVPNSLDWNKAAIRFDYSGSDYADVRSGQGTPEDPYVYRPAPGHLRLWKLDDNGNYRYIEPQVAYTASAFGFGPDNHIADLFVEGVRESVAIGDQRITVEIDADFTDDEPGVIVDAVRVTVVRADLDIDSDNTNGFEADWGRAAYDYEDQIENLQARENFPGKLLAANMGDVDDGIIPNFADGITQFDHTDENAGGNFVPLVLELPAPLDLATARIRFTYSQSDPAELKKNGDGTVYRPDVYVPDPGHLRIWTLDGAAVRNVADVNAGGHFVTSRAIYSATEFEVRPDRTIRVYVEGIDGSAILADQSILVEIDPNGVDEEPGFICNDRVALTVLKLDIIDIDYPNDDVSFTTRNEPPENQITLTADITPDYYDALYKNQIDWMVVNNRWYNSMDSGSFTDDDDPENGETTLLEITMPPVPTAPPVTTTPPYQDGRAWNPLSYKVTAQVTIENVPVFAMQQFVTQDERDMLRQQYIDMGKRETPERSEFLLPDDVATIPGYENVEHFCILCGSAGDGACQCREHEHQLWSIMPNLETLLQKLNEELGRSSDDLITELEIGSGYRCPIRNTTIGRTGKQGEENSNHIYGLAADVYAADWDNDGNLTDDINALNKAAQATGDPEPLLYSWGVHVDW